MIDLSAKVKRVLDIKLPNGKIINMFPPTLRLLGKFKELDKSDIDGFCVMIAKVLSNNRQDYKVTKEMIECLNPDVIEELFNEIYKFTTEIQKEKN